MTNRLLKFAEEMFSSKVAIGDIVRTKNNGSGKAATGPITSVLFSEDLPQASLVDEGGYMLGPLYQRSMELLNERPPDEVRPTFISNLNLGESVNYIPMADNLNEHSNLKFGIHTGIISNIKFTAAKVFYTIVDDYFGYVMRDVDSVHVSRNREDLERLLPKLEPDYVDDHGKVKRASLITIARWIGYNYN